MLLTELVAQLDVVAPATVPDVPVRAVTRDSREVGPDVVFVAIRGARVDGHDLAAGLRAAAVLVERPVQALPGVPVIRVRDTKAALARAASAVCGHPSHTLPVVGVTGTNGKTTVTTLLAQAVAAMGGRSGRIGTTGVDVAGQPRPSALTTPEAPAVQGWLGEMRDAGCRLAAMEVSSIGLDQRRVDGVRFHTGVFTCLGHDHLDHHGTMEAYAAAKARLFTHLLRPAGGLPRALLFADDPAWRALLPPADHWTYGFEGDRDLRIGAWRSDRRGVEAEVRTPQGGVTVRSPLLGRHNVANLVAALGAGLLCGLPLEPLSQALATAPGAPGRMERVPNDRDLLVLVDYAHTPDALTAAIAALRPVTPGRVWVLFGCGGDRDRAKRPEMGRAALSADEVVLTSDNPRSEDPLSILADIRAGTGGAPVTVEPDRGAAIAWVLANAAAGDTVLLAGKGHETTMTIGASVLPFDDRAVARSCLGAS